MYNELLKLEKNGDFEGFAKCLIRYFPMIKDKETSQNIRYCIFKISDKNKFKYAGFKKQNGIVQNMVLNTKELDFINLI